MIRHSRRTLTILAVFLPALFGNWNDTSTGIDLDKLRQFPLVKIRSGRLKDSSRVTFDGISATSGSPYDRQVRLRGTSKSGKKWEAHIFDINEVWRADLDGNGTQDYVFFAGGPNFNGRVTPLFSLSILLMDREGLPVPFFTVVYHGENGEGIKHLVDLNHDGRAELLISIYDEAQSDAQVGPLCSGHWTTQLYRFKDLGVHEIRGAMGNMSFPLVHDWTYGVANCGGQGFLSPLQPARIYEHGTSTLGATLTIRESTKDLGSLAIRPVAGCNMIRPGLLVYDRPQIREIAFPNLFTTYAEDLASRMRQDGAQVELRGIDRWMNDGSCSVNLVWAR
jgi:hypothetical protein